MHIGLGLSIHSRRRGVPTAPDYEEPVGDDPVAPPEGDPVPPTDTPTDPETDAPEPGIDPDFTSATRIDIIDGQAVERTTNDPGTFGVSYIAAELSAGEYWEFTVANSTPKNATFAVGVTTLAMPLNGIPGERATELAWWSDGTVRQNGTTLIDLGAPGRLARGDRGAIAFGPSGEVRLYKNCSVLNASAAVGSLVTASRVYPFVALFSARTRIDMVFTLGKFGCSVPEGYFPINQVPEVPIPLTAPSLTNWFDFSDASTVTDDGTNISAITDKGPGAVTASQDTASRQPLIGTQNGIACATFASGDVLAGTGIDAAFANEDQPYSLFVAISGNAGSFFALNNPLSTNPWTRHELTANFLSVFKQDAAGAIASPNGGVKSYAAAPHIIEFVSTGTTVAVWIDGVLEFDKALNVGAMTGLTRLTIGANIRGAAVESGSWNGNICEIILCKAALGTADREAQRDYLSAKWMPV